MRYLDELWKAKIMMTQTVPQMLAPVNPQMREVTLAPSNPFVGDMARENKSVMNPMPAMKDGVPATRVGVLKTLLPDGVHLEIHGETPKMT